MNLPAFFWTFWQNSHRWISLNLEQLLGQYKFKCLVLADRTKPKLKVLFSANRTYNPPFWANFGSLTKDKRQSLQETQAYYTHDSSKSSCARSLSLPTWGSLYLLPPKSPSMHTIKCWKERNVSLSFASDSPSNTHCIHDIERERVHVEVPEWRKLTSDLMHLDMGCSLTEFQAWCSTSLKKTLPSQQPR